MEFARCGRIDRDIILDDGVPNQFPGKDVGWLSAAIPIRPPTAATPRGEAMGFTRGSLTPERTSRLSSWELRRRDFMIKTAGLTFGFMLVALCLVSISVGSALLVTAHNTPAHTDERRADELARLYEQNYASNPERLEPIRQQIAALRTSKWNLYDAGLDMCLLSATLLFGVVRFRIWDLRNLRTVGTPRSRLGLLGLASIALLALLPALQLQSDYEYVRDDLAPAIDTGRGTILFLGTGLFLLLWIPMMVVGRFLVLRHASLPSNLWCWDNTQHYRSVILTTFFGLVVALLAILLVWSANNFPWAIPSLLVGVYVILSSRAALVSADKEA
jgi:hypothetical protein